MLSQGQFSLDTPAAPTNSAIQSHLTKTTGWSADGIKPMSIQDRYSTYLHYRNDKRRVDAGGDTAPGLADSYKSLKGAVRDQYAGMQSDPSVTKPTFDPNYDANPYPDAAAMTKSISQGQFRVAPTVAGQDTIAWDNDTNDKFRAVHDQVGHAATGATFSPAGESAATESHRRSLPQSAHRALTAEVLGQASYFEFGGGNFVDQKGLYDVPEWAARGGTAPQPPKKPAPNKGVQGRLF